MPGVFTRAFSFLCGFLMPLSSFLTPSWLIIFPSGSTIKSVFSRRDGHAFDHYLSAVFCSCCSLFFPDQFQKEGLGDRPVRYGRPEHPLAVVSSHGRRLGNRLSVRRHQRQNRQTFPKKTDKGGTQKNRKSFRFFLPFHKSQLCTNRDISYKISPKYRNCILHLRQSGLFTLPGRFAAFRQFFAARED